MINDFTILAAITIASTLGVKRLLDLLSVRSRKANLSEEILRHGATPSARVDAVSTGSDYTGLDDKLDSWSVQVCDLALAHRASPFLHDHPKGLPVALTVLDDALSILMRCAPAEERPDGTRLRKLRGAINDMLDTLKNMGQAPTAEVPARPVFPARITAYLDRVGFESKGEFKVRRSLMLAWVRYDGLDWYDDQPTLHIGETAGGKSRATEN